MDGLRDFLVTVFHNSEENNAQVHRALKPLGYKRSFLRENESVDLPENMFVRKTRGDHPQSIRDEELANIIQILEKSGIQHGAIGVFVGEDWTSMVTIDE